MKRLLPLWPEPELRRSSPDRELSRYLVYREIRGLDDEPNRQPPDSTAPVASMNTSTDASTSGACQVRVGAVASASLDAVPAERRASPDRESERLLALHRASTALTAQTAEPDAVLDEVLRSAVDLLEAGSASLYLWDADAEILRCVRN